MLQFPLLHGAKDICAFKLESCVAQGRSTVADACSAGGGWCGGELDDDEKIGDKHGDELHTHTHTHTRTHTLSHKQVTNTYYTNISTTLSYSILNLILRLRLRFAIKSLIYRRIKSNSDQRTSDSASYSILNRSKNYSVAWTHHTSFHAPQSRFRW